MTPHHGYEWLWITLFTILALVMLFKFYYGLFPTPQTTRQMMSAMTILYVENQCNYTDLGAAYMRICKETESFIDIQACQMIGLYFDNPQLVKKSFMCRSALGIVLHSDYAIRKAQNFIKSSPRYQIRSLPSTDCLSMRVPYRNFITYFLIGFFWKKMNGNKLSCNNQPTQEAAGIELYNFQDKSDMHIILNVPLEKREAFNFSSFPRPEYKRVN